MRLHFGSTGALFLLTLLSSLTSAQLLHNSNGQLPSCARRCSVLTQAQSSCGGRSSTSLSTWSCFCAAVWKNSNESPSTMCSSECTNPSDNTAVGTWYTENCGSDNGASEHSGSSGGNGGGSAPAGSSAAPAPSASTAAGTGVTTTPGLNESSCSGWWHCHWVRHSISQPNVQRQFKLTSFPEMGGHDHRHRCRPHHSRIRR